MTPPTKAMLELADEVLMKAMRVADVAKGVMVTTKWKDSIGIDEPSYYARRFAEEILRSSQNKGDSGERDRVIEEALVQSASALAATISLLQRIPKAKMVAPSNKMFDQMMRDYEAALENARVVLCALKSGEKGS